MEHLIDIPGRLHSVAVEKHIAGTDQIYDDILKTTQDILNLENITDVKVQEGKLQFLNIQGQVLKEISIASEQKQSDWNQTDSTQVDFIKGKPTVYNKQEVDDKLITKQDIIDDLVTIRSGAQAGATAYQKPQTGIPATDLASDTQNDLAAIDGIEAVIPEQASPSNQLADKNFVNSSVATNTANYISDNGQPFQSLEVLEAYEGVLTNNDYAFVVGVDSVGNTTYSRYKYNASTQQWALEYVLNNSSFTAEQWESISSGITNSLVAKLSAMPTNSELTTILNEKVDTTDLNKYVPKTDDDGHGNMSIYGQGNITMTLADEQGVINQTGSFWAGGWSVSSPDGKFQTFGNSIYRGSIGIDHDSVVWEKTATQQIPAATTSTNGLMSAEDKGKLNALPTATELVEKLESKATASDLAKVATSGSYNDLSDKPDLSAFITKSVDDLTNYYLKSETYTKNEVLQLIGAIQQFHYEVYATLPQTGASNVLYLIGPIGAGADKYEEYVYANNNWTRIGDTSIDLADYVTSSALSVTLANYYNKNDVDGLLAGKQDTIQDLDAIRRGSQAGATAVQTETLNSALSNTVAESGVYDVTANNNAKFASLSALLSSENLNTLIPSAKRKGGMSIKFVLSSDNIYVQYRLMTEEFSTDVEDWQGVDNVPTADSKNLVTSGGVYDALQGEYVVATATADTGSVATAMVGIYDVNDVLIVEGEGEVTARILYGKTYKVKCSRVYDHLTPAEQTFVASIPSRQVMMQYTYIERDVVTLDQTISDPAQMLSGDIQGDVIKEIRSHSHLYLGTPATQPGDTEGTELLCQLSDEDSRLYYDGTPAALDGSEGDQWLKLPVFWWKVVGVGEAAVDGAHDQYRLMFAFAGEPDPSWNKWQGDRNLVGAKEMKVVNDKGRSVSDGQSTGGFIQAKGNAYAAARNLGCQLVTWEWHWIMCVLFYAWYGNTNSQAVCGIGSSSYNRTLGVTDKLGMTDTTPAQATSLTSARFWGLESWWNCKIEWMGNVVMEDYVLRITDQDTKQTRQVSGFIQCGSSGGWNSRMRIDANGDLVPLAKAGTETTFYCDWVNSNSGSRGLNRSSANAVAYGGVAYVGANLAHSSAYAHLGSRLAFNGAITEAESVAAYKAALA